LEFFVSSRLGRNPGGGRHVILPATGYFIAGCGGATGKDQIITPVRILPGAAAQPSRIK
jgi:hypothetical protein